MPDGGCNCPVWFVINWHGKKRKRYRATALQSPHEPARKQGLAALRAREGNITRSNTPAIG